jgi:hypothetical protein
MVLGNPFYLRRWVGFHWEVWKNVSMVGEISEQAGCEGTGDFCIYDDLLDEERRVFVRISISKYEYQISSALTKSESSEAGIELPKSSCI